VVEADRRGSASASSSTSWGISSLADGPADLEDVRVPRENVIGEVGRGLSVALGTLERTRLGAAAQAVGIAQGATDYAVGYARERVQFGKPIMEFQAIQFKLADMETRTAAARELLYKAPARWPIAVIHSAQSNSRWRRSSARTRRWR
jgi:alkylation response protein AidB-like acyl-CoA dehydrogenase